MDSSAYVASPPFLIISFTSKQVGKKKKKKHVDSLSANRRVQTPVSCSKCDISANVSKNKREAVEKVPVTCKFSHTLVHSLPDEIFLWQSQTPDFQKPRCQSKNSNFTSNSCSPSLMFQLLTMEQWESWIVSLGRGLAQRSLLPFWRFSFYPCRWT